MALMQKDYIYPEIADRTSPKEWAEQGSLDIFATGATADSGNTESTLSAAY